MTLCVLVMALIGISLTRKPTDNQCARQLSMWCKSLGDLEAFKHARLTFLSAPALEAVEYVTFDFDNAFNSTSKYRGPPTPEVEEVWFNLTYKHAVEIPEDKIAGLNRSEKDHLAHVPADVGTGYVALLEVFYQLYCLNMIRMFTWWQAGKYPGVPSGLYEAPEDVFRNRMHIDHCLESLRIALMCWGDVTPLLVRLDRQGYDGRKTDFNTHHKCRNWDKIESWMDENWTVYNLYAHSPAIPFRNTLSNLGYLGHIILAGWIAYDGVIFWKRQTNFNQKYATIQDIDNVGSYSSVNPPLKQPSHHWGYGRIMLGFAWQVMLCTAIFLAGSVITAAILPRQH
ncbi:uncharacterized protein PgNI_02498 [Pyricularia grisea]|uniref:Uncharacterized protein n=1 Tax=Pyricularia grisea TaxID=148305 RepID=A0A6P8BG96_PYRGI|nr:uncharacterized protein PgNI_02498 [Pyricularia grisea]TLD15798.1 hypothetical protein PgNI_02498 [Pyricularia grisea]